MIEEGVDLTKDEKAKKIKQLLELTECSLTGENIMDLTRKGEQQDLINFDLHQQLKFLKHQNQIMLDENTEFKNEI